MRRTLAISIALLVLVSGCGGGAEARRGDELCALIDLEVQARLDEGIDAVLSGAKLDSYVPVEESCEQRYITDDEWIEISFIDASTYEGADLVDAGNGLFTNGVDASRVTVGDSLVVALVRSSSPASISSWDASLAAATALVPAR